MRTNRKRSTFLLKCVSSVEQTFVFPINLSVKKKIPSKLKHSMAFLMERKHFRPS